MYMDCCRKNAEDRKGESHMVVTTLESIEQRVKKNSVNNAKMISNFQKRIGKRGLKEGRIRPRNKVEQQILNSFKHK